MLNDSSFLSLPPQLLLLHRNELPVTNHAKGPPRSFAPGTTCLGRGLPSTWHGFRRKRPNQCCKGTQCWRVDLQITSESLLLNTRRHHLATILMLFEMWRQGSEKRRISSQRSGVSLWKWKEVPPSLSL